MKKLLKILSVFSFLFLRKKTVKKSGYKVRELYVDDVFKIVALLKKLKDTQLKNVMVSIENMVNDGGDKKEVSDDSVNGKSNKNVQQMTQIGMMIVDELLEFLESDFTEWIASMVGLSVDEFKKAPVCVLEEIIESLLDGGANNGFFLRAYNLYKKTSK